MADTSRDAEISDLVAKLRPTKERFEGRSPWMYLDHLGHLTIGIGHLLVRKGASEEKIRKAIQGIWKYGITNLRVVGSTQYASACRGRIPGPHSTEGRRGADAMITRIDQGHFSLPDDKFVPGVWGYDLPFKNMTFVDAAKEAGSSRIFQTVSIDSMVKEAVNIIKLGYGYKDAIRAYECYNSFQIWSSGIDELLGDDIRQKIRELVGEPAFAAFWTFPIDAQVALVDLAFQGGARGVANHTAFSTAVAANHWDAAAQAVPFSDTKTTQQARTNWRKDHFEAAAKAHPWSSRLTPKSKSEAIPIFPGPA